jgi:hypothetical protein
MIQRIGRRAIHADLGNIIVVLNVQHAMSPAGGDQPAGLGALKI